MRFRFSTLPIISTVIIGCFVFIPIKETKLSNDFDFKTHDSLEFLFDHINIKEKDRFTNGINLDDEALLAEDYEKTYITPLESNKFSYNGLKYSSKSEETTDDFNNQESFSIIAAETIYEEVAFYSLNYKSSDPDDIQMISKKFELKNGKYDLENDMVKLSILKEKKADDEYIQVTYNTKVFELSVVQQHNDDFNKEYKEKTTILFLLSFILSMITLAMDSLLSYRKTKISEKYSSLENCLSIGFITKRFNKKQIIKNKALFEKLKDSEKIENKNKKKIKVNHVIKNE